MINNYLAVPLYYRFGRVTSFSGYVIIIDVRDELVVNETAHRTRIPSLASCRESKTIVSVYNLLFSITELVVYCIKDILCAGEIV